jgi:membrane protease subunit HflK
LLFVLGTLFLTWTAATALTQVQSGERAVIRRFGRILPIKPEPGLYVGLPWGIERVDLVPVAKSRTIKVGVLDTQEVPDEGLPIGQMLTGDHNLVNVQAEIAYRVREEDVEQFVLQANNVESLIARAAESVLAEWSAGRTVDQVLRGKGELPGFLRDHLRTRLKDYQLGVEIERASITRLLPPDQVKDAFEQVAQAETSIQTKRNFARQEADQKENRARGKIYEIESSARAYAAAEAIRAKADADTFRQRLTQYRELCRTNPDYLNVMWLNEMTALYARMKDAGRIELLDDYLAREGLSITQFPLQSKKR